MDTSLSIISHWFIFRMVPLADGIVAAQANNSRLVGRAQFPDDITFKPGLIHDIPIGQGRVPLAKPVVVLGREHDIFGTVLFGNVDSYCFKCDSKATTTSTFNIKTSLYAISQKSKAPSHPSGR